MAADRLVDLLERNRKHVESLPSTYFDEVQEAQHPRVVSVCCSDSRVSQEGMWSVDEPGWLFTPSNLGNQTWDRQDGERIVNGSLAYPIVHTGVRNVAVVGHTGCGAVTAAYGAVTGDGGEQAGSEGTRRGRDRRRERDREGRGNEPDGIRKWVDLLVPVVEDGLASDAVDETADDEAVVNQLVEYNVRRQVAFLRESDEVPDDAAVYGFVYDFQGVYGDERGRTYLVNLDGETDPAAIRAAIPDEHGEAVHSLLA